MRGTLGLMAICVSLAGAGVAACPPFSGAHPAASGGPLAFTAMGGKKTVSPPRRRLAIPEGPGAGVRIGLRRSGCYGTCPSYSIEVSGTGQGRYHGGAYALVTGDHDVSLPPETVACLIEDFRKVDFWALASDYVAPVTDNPTTVLTLSVGGQRKTLRDYAGRRVGMPREVTDLEDAIDLAAAQPWVTGDARTVPNLRAEHFDFRSPAGAQLLANAAELDSVDVALALLAAGAPATGHGFSGLGRSEHAAVEAAAGHGRVSLTRALIAAGALSDPAPDLRERVLHAAVKSGDPDTVTVALAQAPRVNARIEDGTTVLMEIASEAPDPPPPDLAQRRLAILRALLAAGADPRLRDASDHTALATAEAGEEVRLLLSAGAELERRNGYGDTPLLAAGLDEVAMALIKAGADTTAINDKGEDLTTKAKAEQWPRTLAWLAAHGSSARRAKRPPAAWPPDLKALADRRFDFHSREAGVMLIRAADEGRDQLALDLLAAGAPANQVSADLTYMDSPSAIAAASASGKLGLVRALIAAGAFSDPPYHARETALREAVKTPWPEVAAELLKTGPDLHGADEDAILPLVGSKLPDRAENAPRWRAASLETLRLLLAAGVDPRSSDAVGDTALHHAASPEVVALLVKAGASLEARNQSGETPLLTTLDDDVAMALIQAGADITAKDDLGRTALDKAAELKFVKTIAYLKAHGITKADPSRTPQYTRPTAAGRPGTR